jgi:hypothetical protein
VEPPRKVFAQPSNPDIAWKKPEPGNQLVDVEQQLALPNGVEEHRDGADLHCVRAQPEEVTGDALQLGNENADVLDPLWHLEPQELLDTERVRQAVRLGGQVVHPFDERDDLLPLLLLGCLLDARMQIPNRRGRGANDFPIELEHQTQHAMRAGVLWPHVDRHCFRAKFSHGCLGKSLVSSLWSLVSWFTKHVVRRRPTRD